MTCEEEEETMTMMNDDDDDDDVLGELTYNYASIKGTPGHIYFHLFSADLSNSIAVSMLFSFTWYYIL